MGKFFGTYQRNLDAKNRLLLPSKLMGEMPSRLYLLKGFEGAISLYPEASFERYLSSLESLSLLDPKARSYLRLALGSIVPLELDSHSRITFPSEIMMRYKLGEEVVILGMLDHIEIFEKGAYEAMMAKEEGAYETLASSLSEALSASKAE